MSVKVVVPRVIPLFIDDVKAASFDRKLQHLDAFSANMPRVFASRCEAPDVLDGVEFLISLTRADALGEGATPEQQQALRLRALKCLAVMFADAEAYTPRTYAAARSISVRLARERAEQRDALARALEQQTATDDAAASNADAPPAAAASEPDAAASGDASPAAAGSDAATAAAPPDEPQEAEDAAGAPREGGKSPVDEAVEDAPPPAANDDPAPTTEGDAHAEAAAAPPADSNNQQQQQQQSTGDERLLRPLPDDPTALQDHTLCLDDALHDLVCRGAVIKLLQKWDAAMIDVTCFVASPQTMHVYLPHRINSGPRVFRDFLTCSRRPKLTRPWGPASYVHIKTNIKAQSDVMYRFVVEGYNYGVNAAIFSDVVGCTNRRWREIGNMAQYGWPEGWDAAMTNDYAPGCVISQYYSRDRYLVLRLKAKSFFSVGFTVSAWLVFHGYGEGFLVAGQTYHQDDDL